MTVVSGEWRPEDANGQLAEADDGVSLNESDSCEPVEPDSPDGQLILVEAMRTLERRLSPEARAMIRDSSAHPHAEPEEFNSPKEKGLGP